MSTHAIWTDTLPAVIDRIVSIPASQPIEDQLQPGEEAVTLDDADHETTDLYIDMVLGAPAAIERPSFPPPPAFAADVTATWEGLPEGAVLTVENGDGAPSVTVDASHEVEIQFAAGTWEVSLDAPFPWRRETFTIEVE